MDKAMNYRPGKTFKIVSVMTVLVCLLVPLFAVDAGAALAGYTQPPYYARAKMSELADAETYLLLYDGITDGIKKQGN